MAPKKDSLPTVPAPSLDTMSRKKRTRVQQTLQILAEQQKHPDPEQRWVTASIFARKFACNERTVYRLMDALRDDHALPIESKPGRGGFRLYEPVSTLPTVVYTRLETLALCVSMGSMSMFEGTIFGKPARSMVEKMTAGLCDDLALEFDSVSSAVSFHCTGAESHIDPQTFTELLPALVQHRELEIEYAKGPANTLLSSGADEFALDGRRDSAPGRRRIEPLHLACIDYGWYLFAWDPAQNDVRNFALRRIRSIRTTGATRAPRPFDIKTELEASFGAYRSALKDAQTVRLRFWGAAAQIVPEFIWHRTQQFSPVPRCSRGAPNRFPGGGTIAPWDVPGAIEMTMKVAPNPKLLGWIKQWLGEVAVVEPVPLRDLVRAAALKGAADQDMISGR